MTLIDSHVLMNTHCSCPGWVRTDMAGQQADLSIDEGAVTPVHCCFLPADAPNGAFWKDKQVAAAL